MMTAPEELAKLRPELRYLRIRVQTQDRARLTQKSKADRLEKENKELRDQVKKLKEELDKIKKQRDTYKGMIFKAKVVTSSLEDKTERRLGGQLGHIGVGRKVPARIDKQIRVFLNSCPHCSTPLKRSDTFETHTVEDIPNFEVTKTVVTKYKSERQWCSNCHKEVVGKPTQVISHSKLGLNLIIQILIFKYVCRMSLEVMVSTLFQTYGVKITEGGIIDILKRTKRWLGQIEYGRLLASIRSSPIKHADETGWRIKGINGWLWAFLTKTEVYYTIEETRGKGVAERILSASSKDDVLVRDDYGGYKNLKLNQQSCWAHLLRKSKEETLQKGCSKQMGVLHSNLKQLYQKLEIEISKPFNLEKRIQIHQYYADYLKEITSTKFKAKDAQRIQTRITNQGNNLITALLHDGIPLTNNAAERSIRPAVVIRKISGGSRSDIGAETFAVNFSVIQSIRMRDQPLIPTLQTMILKGTAGEN